MVFRSDGNIRDAVLTALTLLGSNGQQISDVRSAAVRQLLWIVRDCEIESGGRVQRLSSHQLLPKMGCTQRY